MTTELSTAGGARRPRRRRVAAGVVVAAAVVGLGGWLTTRVPDLPERAILRGRPATISDLAYSPDGRSLAVVSDEDLALWDVGAGSVSWSVPRTHRFADLAFSRDGRAVVVAGWDADAYVADAPTGRTIAALPGTSGPLGMAFSPDGKTLAVVSFRFHDDELLTTWDTATWAERSRRALPVRYERVCGQVSPDGRFYAVCNQDEGSTIRLFDLDGGQERGSFQIPANASTRLVFSLAFSPDGRRLASGHDGGMARVWDVGSGGLLATYQGHDRGINVRALFGADGKALVTLGSGFPRPRRLPPLPFRLDEWLTPPPPTGVEVVEWAVRDSPSGRLRGRHSEASRLRPVPGENLSLGETMATAISPDGRTLATARKGGTIRLREVP